METNVFEDRYSPGLWRVESFDEEGTCYGATFWGREAEKRARHYATVVRFANNFVSGDRL